MVPAFTGIIESCMYVEDLERATAFYEQVLGLRLIAGDDRFAAYSVADRDVLLLFKKGASTEAFHFSGGMIPPHDGSGHNHLAFSVSVEELVAWERKLIEENIEIESRVRWPAGGNSIYFRDPDENLLEIATPGLWPIY